MHSVNPFDDGRNLNKRLIACFLDVNSFIKRNPGPGHLILEYQDDNSILIN